MKQGKKMDEEEYIVYGMIFGFLTLWLLFSLVKQLGNSSKFPKQKRGKNEEES